MSAAEVVAVVVAAAAAAPHSKHLALAAYDRHTVPKDLNDVVAVPTWRVLSLGLSALQVPLSLVAVVRYDFLLDLVDVLVAMGNLVAPAVQRGVVV